MREVVQMMVLEGTIERKRVWISTVQGVPSVDGYDVLESLALEIVLWTGTTM